MKHPFLAIATTLAIAGASTAQSTTRVSLGVGDVQGNGACEVRPVISADGRFVAWSSLATNVVPGDTNGGADVFVRDLLAGGTERVSVTSTGSEAHGGSSAPSLSADGRFVAFHSAATDLVAPDGNMADDVFVRDRWTGVTERVSSAPGGASGSGISRGPSLSADGDRVAFMSESADLVPGDTNSKWDVFVHERSSGVTRRVSVHTLGFQGNGISQHPSISADGMFVAFVSAASNLVPLDTNGDVDVFVHELATGITTLVHVDSNGVQANFDADDESAPGISADGRYVAFGSLAWNLAPGDTNARYDVFLHDRFTRITGRITRDLSGEQSDDHSRECRISHDGRHVLFVSWATDLVFGDTNGFEDVFLHDTLSGATERLNLSDGGAEADGGGFGVSMSGDAGRIVFHSQATALVAGDTNGSDDVFLRDRVPAPSASVVCVGDGSGAACPCGNPSPPGDGAGCAHSFGLAGRLLSSGMPRVSDDTFVLLGGGMPNSSALYFQGTATLNGGLGAPFGDGLRCAGGSVVRLGTKTNVGGTSQYPEGGDLPISVRGMVPPAGATRAYQVWYRNAAAFCTTATFNLTNGMSAAWVP